jgi:hypothetical protein
MSKLVMPQIWLRNISAFGIAGALACAAGLDNPVPPSNSNGAAPVLRPSEPADTVIFKLPGLPPPTPRALKPFSDPPPIPVGHTPLVPNAPEAALPVAVPDYPLTAPTRPPLKPFELSEPSPSPETAPNLPEMPAPVLVMPDSKPPEGLSSLRRPPKPWFPPDFDKDSAAYCQQRIAEWSKEDAYNLLGMAVRQRAAAGDNGDVTGRIYAFADPTGRYREIELDFAAETGLLRTVFVYPKAMTWSDARRTWGTDVSSTGAKKGRIFYSYTNRRLDVLVGPDGKVISLGLY